MVWMDIRVHYRLLLLIVPARDTHSSKRLGVVSLVKFYPSVHSAKGDQYPLLVSVGEGEAVDEVMRATDREGFPCHVTEFAKLVTKSPVLVSTSTSEWPAPSTMSTKGRATSWLI